MLNSNISEIIKIGEKRAKMKENVLVRDLVRICKNVQNKDLEQIKELLWESDGGTSSRLTQENIMPEPTQPLKTSSRMDHKD